MRLVVFGLARQAIHLVETIVEQEVVDNVEMAQALEQAVHTRLEQERLIGDMALEHRKGNNTPRMSEQDN